MSADEFFYFRLLKPYLSSPLRTGYLFVIFQLLRNRLANTKVSSQPIYTIYIRTILLLFQLLHLLKHCRNYS